MGGHLSTIRVELLVKDFLFGQIFQRISAQKLQAEKLGLAVAIL
jgi:hypothetical protein